MNRTLLIATLFLILGIKTFSQAPKGELNKTKKIEEKLKDNSIYKERLATLQAKKDSLLPIGVYKDVNAIYQDLLSLTTAEADTLNIVLTLKELLDFNYHSQKIDVAENYGLEIENLLKHKEDKDDYYPILADVRVVLSYLYANSSKSSNSLESALIANQIFKKIKNIEKVRADFMYNYVFLSMTYQEMNDNDQAINSIESALGLYKKDENVLIDSILADCYLQLGNIYHERHIGSNEGIRYLKKALEIVTQLKDPDRITIALMNLGRASSNTNQEIALNYFKKALKQSKEENANVAVSLKMTIYNELAYHYLKYHNDPIALKYADSSLNLGKAYDYVSIKSKSLRLKSNFYKQNNQPDLALKFLEDNLNHAKSKNSPDLTENAYSTLFNFYNESGNMKFCERYYNKYIISKQNNEAAVKASKLELLEVAYKYREAASKLEKEKIALQLSELDKKQIKIKSYFSIGIFLLILMFIVIIARKQKKQAKIEKMAIQMREELLLAKKEALDKEIAFKNKSVTDFALQINEKNNLLKNLKSELKRVKPLNSNSKHILTDAIKYISDDIEQNEEKVQLYAEVNKKNNEFELKINEKYPNLTDKERKILTRVKLRQGSKQIANQLNISVASVDNYRYRIRKKIKVPKGQLLENFINEL